MLGPERQAKILDELQRRGTVRVTHLSEMLDVSDMTIRRDLEVLSRRGLIEKVHGGATRPRTSTDEPGFEAKSLRQLAEKRALARAAAELVTPGMAIGVSAGTTTWTLVHRLRNIDGLTVVTNSIRIADVLHVSNGPHQSVVLTGGVRTPSDALVGPIAVSALAQLHLDIVFLGVHGMTEDAGFTTPNLLEADTDQALVKAGRRLVVVADHTKWGTIGIRTIAHLHEADIVITDDGLSDAARTVLESHVREVRIIPIDHSAAEF